MLDIMLPPIIQMWISFLKRIQIEPQPIVSDVRQILPCLGFIGNYHTMSAEYSYLLLMGRSPFVIWYFSSCHSKMLIQLQNYSIILTFQVFGNLYV